MTTIDALPSDSPFYLEIVAEIAQVTEGASDEDRADVEYHYAMPLEADLVEEALRAHDIYETYLDLTG